MGNEANTTEPGNVDANIIAAAAAQLLQWRDVEAALTLASLPQLDPMARSEAKGTERMVGPRRRVALSKTEMARIYIRDSWRCRYCGRKLVFPYVLVLYRTLVPGFKGLLPGHHMPFADTERAVECVYPNVDHVEPRLHDPQNLVTACTPCNSRKSDWLGWPRPGPPSCDPWDGLVSSYRAIVDQRRVNLSPGPAELQWVSALLRANAQPLKTGDN